MHRRDLLKLSAMFGLSTVSAGVSRALYAGITGESGTTKHTFTTEQRRSVVILSDLIIPPTDTPGAVAAKVPEFVEIIYADWYRNTEREIFLQGIAKLNTFCLQKDQKLFNETSEAIQVAALQAQEAIAAQYKPANGGFSFQQSFDEHTPFFTKIKELVVLGYYTSEVGAKQELIYLPMPGHYDGDYDFKKVGRQWTY